MEKLQFMIRIEVLRVDPFDHLAASFWEADKNTRGQKLFLMGPDRGKWKIEFVPPSCGSLPQRDEAWPVIRCRSFQQETSERLLHIMPVAPETSPAPVEDERFFEDRARRVEPTCVPQA